MLDMIHIYTGGTFDVPHMGHYMFFKKVKGLFPNPSYITVGLNTDKFVKEFKGKPPLFDYNERERWLRQIPFVDYVLENRSGADSKPTILFAKPNVIVIGNDWLEKDYCKQMGFDAQWLRDKNIALCYIPYTEGISSSEIKKRLKLQIADDENWIVSYA